MGIHKEGRAIISTTAAAFAAIALLCTLFICPLAGWIAGGAGVLATLFTMFFFRVPCRQALRDDNMVFAPADGEVVAIEEVEEKEFFGDRRIQVSVFMSVWNIHINWFPVRGTVEYFRHHHGKYLVAWHPKSSEENERTTVVVDCGGHKVLFRQIAGTVARRIVSYAHVGNSVEQNSQCGFIKFGSRVDLFLPLDAEVRVSIGDKVTGTHTVIAEFGKTAPQ